MLLESIISLWLVVDPNGARTIWDVQPNKAKVSPGAKIFVLPDGWKENEVQYMVDDGNGNLVVNKPAPVVIDGPNLQGFIDAIRSDAAYNDPLASTDRLKLAIVFSAFKDDVNNPQLLQRDWSDAVANGWVSQSAAALVLKHATTYKIPLVP